MLRALIIQPIIDSLSASFTNMFAQGGGSSGIGGGSPFGSIMSGIMGMFGGGGGVQGGVDQLLSGNLFAKGGTFQPNTDILVGEDGPEILRTGSRGGQIFPNDMLEEQTTGAVQRNQTNNIVVNLPAQMQRRSAQQTATEVVKVQRRANSRNY